VINFRYHVVSLIAVFLALAIGVIMGSAVIDRAIVDRLEDQQQGLREDLDDIERENDALRTQNRDLQESASQLADQGSQRLLTGTLTDVPVLVIATRGSDDDGFKGLLSLLTTSDADERGTIWLTDRWSLDDDDEVRDLAAALEAPSTFEADGLRTLAMSRLSAFLRERAGPAVIDDPSMTTTTSTTAAGAPATEGSTFTALRDSGFVDFDPPERAQESDGPRISPGTRIVFVSSADADVPTSTVSVPFAEMLVDDRPGVPLVALLAAENRGSVADPDPASEFVVGLRDDDESSVRMSTVDNIGDFAGRLAAVLAIADLGDGRVGHFGRGPGAQRLLPAPPESGG
jgi:hypothetical protein